MSGEPKSRPNAEECMKQFEAIIGQQSVLSRRWRLKPVGGGVLSDFKLGLKSCVDAFVSFGFQIASMYLAIAFDRSADFELVSRISTGSDRNKGEESTLLKCKFDRFVVLPCSCWCTSKTNRHLNTIDLSWAAHPHWVCDTFSLLVEFFLYTRIHQI